MKDWEIPLGHDTRPLNPYHRHRSIVLMKVKKEDGMDPLVHLGMWKGAGLIKQCRGGNKNNSPIMPELRIGRHDWSLYIEYTDSALIKW